MSLQTAMLKARCTPYPHSYPQPQAVTMEAVMALEARCEALEAKVSEITKLLNDVETEKAQPVGFVRRIDSKP